MFDIATLREEMQAIERKIEIARGKMLKPDDDLINRWVVYSRKLRDAEYRENGYVTARNGMTGY